MRDHVVGGQMIAVLHQETDQRRHSKGVTMHLLIYHVPATQQTKTHVSRDFLRDQVPDERMFQLLILSGLATQEMIDHDLPIDQIQKVLGERDTGGSRLMLDLEQEARRRRRRLQFVDRNRFPTPPLPQSLYTGMAASYLRSRRTDANSTTCMYIHEVRAEMASCLVSEPTSSSQSHTKSGTSTCVLWTKQAVADHTMV
jgi:hypothetical protein